MDDEQLQAIQTSLRSISDAVAYRPDPPRYPDPIDYTQEFMDISHTLGRIAIALEKTAEANFGLHELLSAAQKIRGVNE